MNMLSATAISFAAHAREFAGFAYARGRHAEVLRGVLDLANQRLATVNEGGDP